MKTIFSRLLARYLSVATAMVAVVAGPSLSAQDRLEPGETTFTNFPNLPVVSSFSGDQQGSTFTGIVNELGFHFTLTSAVYKNVSINPFGTNGLVFAYKLTNYDAPDIIDSNRQDPAWGIIGLTFRNFQGFFVAVGEGAESGVVPGPASRSSDGNDVTFSYPATADLPSSPPPPPIYPGPDGNDTPYFSNTLYVFTNAGDYTLADQAITNGMIEYAKEVTTPAQASREHAYDSIMQNIQAYSPVPDHASSGGLMCLGVAFLFFGARGRRRFLR